MYNLRGIELLEHNYPTAIIVNHTKS